MVETEAKKPNITIKVILELSVATMVETHSKVNIADIHVDNQMAIIQVQIRKNIIKDVLFDGGASVNIKQKTLEQN